MMSHIFKKRSGRGKNKKGKPTSITNVTDEQQHQELQTISNIEVNEGKPNTRSAAKKNVDGAGPLTPQALQDVDPVILEAKYEDASDAESCSNEDITTDTTLNSSDDSDSDDDDDDDNSLGCFVCNTTDIGNWQKCIFCRRWFHWKCIGIAEVKMNNDKKLNWHCKNCYKEIKKTCIGYDEAKIKIKKMELEKVNLIKKIKQIQYEHDRTENDMKEEINRCKTIIENLKKNGYNADIGIVTENIDKLETAFKNEIANLKTLMREQGDKRISETEEIKAKLVNERSATSKPMSYADKLKGNHTLVIRSTDDGKKVVDIKNEISKNLKDIPINKTIKANNGNLVLKFEDKSTLLDAKAKLESTKEDWYQPLERAKYQPKIKICNVPRDEEKEEAICNILNKNLWLKNLVKNEEDFKLITELKDYRFNDIKHYIIRCTPEIRKEIRNRRDEMYTENTKCNVKDTYHIWQCYRCQGFGHTQNFKGKSCDKKEACAKCGKEHLTRSCTVAKENECCINCKNAGVTNDEDLNHRSSSKICPRYLEEISKIRNNTDHGFQP